MLNAILRRLAAWLLGPGLTMSDETLDGIELAIREEAERMGAES